MNRSLRSTHRIREVVTLKAVDTEHNQITKEKIQKESQEYLFNRLKPCIQL